MRTWSILTSAVLTAAISATVFAGEDKEETIKLNAAPAAVQAAIKKAVAAGELGDVVKESEDGKTVYEAEFELNDVDHSVKVSESGDVIEEEMEVEVSALPAAVSAAVKAKHADAEIEEASLVKADGKTYYELSVEVGEKDHEIKVDATGKILDDKIEAEEKDEDHDHKDHKDDHEHGEKK